MQKAIMNMGQGAEELCFLSEGQQVCYPASRIERMLRAESDNLSPWRIFRIMSEFVSGFEFLNRYQNAVSVFGSARLKQDDTIYQEVRLLSSRLAESGFTIVTGGGPGVMEAANRGAQEVGGTSVGIAIKLKHEQQVNKYVTEYETFKYFFTRKVMLAIASQVYVFFPGGFGTLDELFEMLTLVQTEKIDPLPIILVGRDYWQPLVGWFEQMLLTQHKMIKQKDLHIFHVVDSAEEAHRLCTELAPTQHASAGRATEHWDLMP